MSSESRTFLLLRPPLDIQKTWPIVGAFVQNPYDPVASFVPEDRTKLAATLGALTSPVVELPLSDFESQANDSSAWQAQAQLSDIFKVRPAVNGVNFKMHAQHAIVRKAQNFYDMFDQMMKYNQIRTELIEPLRRNGGIMYMAVAALVLTDAQLTVGHNRNSIIYTNSGQSLPGSVQPPASTGTHRGLATTQSETYKADGQRISGVQYHKFTKRSFLGSGRVKLGNNTYRGKGKNAIFGDENEDEDDNQNNDSPKDVEITRVDLSEESRANDCATLKLNI